MAYRLKDYLYNDKLTKEQNILMDRLYKLRMSGMAEAFEKQLLEPNTGLEPFEVRFADIVNHEWDQRESKKFKRLMKKASLKYPAADLDSSIYDPERQLNTHVIELLAKCDWIDEPNNLLMTGDGVIIGLSQATFRKRGPRRLSPILVTGGENNGAGFSAYISSGIFPLLKGSARYPSYQIRRNFYMAFKNTRNIKVISQNGYNYKPTPTIMLKGQWLRAVGFEIGNQIKVECEDGKLVILLDREKEEEIEAEKAFMEAETKMLKARFEAEKKEIHARYVAERKAAYGA